MQIAGRVALVTGAAAGTGRAIARRLAAEGASVVVADVDPEAGHAAAAAIGGVFAPLDVTDSTALEALVASAAPTILVNNAGGGGHIPPHFPEAPPDDWGATLDLNLRAPMLATQLALEPMRRAGGGAVVNVASTAGLGLEVHASPEYAAAKAGLIRFTATLADLRDVRVTCVVPDWILTERAEEELARMSPAERAAAPVPVGMDEIAGVVAGLVRDDACAGRVVVMRGGEPPRRIASARSGP